MCRRFPCVFALQGAADFQVGRVVPQLQATPELLTQYLMALFAREPHLVAPYGDLQVRRRFLIV